MKVLFAISNPPTKEFISNRHNVGRLFVTEHLMKKYPHRTEASKKYQWVTFKPFPNLIVGLSETYMNLSG